ncbi:MAG: PG0870-related protein, partial [Bacteroidota bacterium]|nr:PG0870-related protein [Bacteroidota bacterium]
MHNSTEYRFNLSRKHKHLCPACGKKRFVRYHDSETNEYIPEQYGRCDRVDNCG